MLSHNYAQQPDVKWSARFVDSQKSFIENKGQFDGRNNLTGTKILFAMDNRTSQILFTTQGLTYRFDSWYRNPDRKKGDQSKPKYLLQTEYIQMKWEGASSSAVLLAEDETGSQNTYSILSDDRKTTYAIENVKGYQKLIYKNLYQGIDAEYVFHPLSGIKYSFILHPGADIKQVTMKFTNGTVEHISETGSLLITTSFGDIIEHKPQTFYADGNKETIYSAFAAKGTEISFDVGNYDPSRPVVIDPWVQLPVLPNSNGVWECETDSFGNVYIIGGDSPMRLQKYNPSGVLQWTYNTPWDTVAGDWLGTIKTDRLGNSYITSGSIAAMQKINTNGNLIWSVSGNQFQSDEYWSIAFNCDQTKMMVGGTRLNTSFLPQSHGVIFSINTLNGVTTDTAFVANTRTHPAPFPIMDINEVRAITSSGSSNYYFLTLDTIGAVNENFTGTNLFGVNSSYNFGYKSEYFRPKNGNSGICAIRANDSFLYTQNGRVIHKRSLLNGSILTTTIIPGGKDTVIGPFGLNMPLNSGIDIDNCGNVYAGSADRVIKFDPDLNIIDSVMLPFSVFDVTVSTNGDIIVAGTTGNSASVQRSGYVQSVNMSACIPFTITSCCNASIYPAGPYYINGEADTLKSATSGGTWSGPGITDTLSGIFNPSVAGYGTHTIIYTIGCGSDSTLITVRNPLSICVTPDSMLAVSNGLPPYAWQ